MRDDQLGHRVAIGRESDHTSFPARPLRGSLLASALGLVLLAAGCREAMPTPGPAAAAATPEPRAVRVAEVQRGSRSSVLTYSGNVQAKQQVAIVPKVAGRVTRLHVDVGSAVQAGDLLVELDRDALAVQVAQAEAALAAAQAKLSGLEAGPRAEQVAQAEANLEMAQQRLAALERGGLPEQVALAEANLDAARARLEQVKKGATPQEVEQARLAVDQAKNALWSAQTNRDGVCGNPRVPQYQCDAANAQVAAAETAVQQAQARLAQVQAGATPEQIAQAEAAVRAAEEQVKLARQPVGEEELSQARSAVRAAEAQLALARRPVTQHDLDAARAAVAQAKAALDLARLQLDEAAIRAPFAGLVAQRMVAEGAMAGPTAPILTLIAADVEVVVNVAEGSLGALQVGQEATVTATAYPGERFSARIASIAPSVDARSRTGQVRLAVDDAGKLRDGMFAQVQLALGAGEQVLLVPRDAVVQDGSESVAYVVAGDRVRRRPVSVGASDGDRIEIVAGLAEGERVAVGDLATLEDNQLVSVR